MNKPDYHSQIMNLPANVPNGLGVSPRGPVAGYKMGHRDARHAAAELAAKADATISELVKALQDLASMVEMDDEWSNPSTDLYVVRHRVEDAIRNATLASLPAAELQP